MIKKFNSLEEIQKYYDAESNTYVFKENGTIFDVYLNFDLKINAGIRGANIKAKNIIAWDIRAKNIDADDINAMNIRARDIKSKDINALDINAMNIDAKNISYYAVCFVYYNIKCTSIKGRRKKAKHFVLNGTIEIKDA